MQTDKSNVVTRFLNRLLGMNLNRQKFMFRYFMAALDNVVIAAKRAGTYDTGITTLTGNNIEVRVCVFFYLPIQSRFILSTSQLSFSAGSLLANHVRSLSEASPQRMKEVSCL